MLRELAPALWVAERPLRFAGVQVGARMSVIRLWGGELFLHSPIALDDSLREELAGLGRVRFVVAPNRFHHLYVGDYLRSYPELQAFAAPGLGEKRPDLCFAGVLGDAAPPGWAGQLEQHFFAGFPLANEVAFFHPASRTLITADLAFNIGAESPLLTRLFFRLNGGYRRFGPTRVERILIRDRVAARASLERILEWDFDRVVVAHGLVLESGGHEALRTSYAWLLESDGP